MTVRLHPKPSEVIAAKLQMGRGRQDKASRLELEDFG